MKPDVIFYIGANQAPGNPRSETLRALRKIAPTVLLCSDAADTPWHPVLRQYRKLECFDLLVALDGSRTQYVGMAVLTPVSPEMFSGVDEPRDIRCGFSGTVGRWNARSETINALEWFGDLTVRRRETVDGYDDHARFMRRCRMILNLSYTGSQLSHHIKGRVIEAGLSGCALLESAGSPIADWFPEGCWFTFRDPPEAAAMIRDLSDAEIEKAASALSGFVREHYMPKHIYGSILEKLGLPRRPSSIKSADYPQQGAPS